MVGWYDSCIDSLAFALGSRLLHVLLICLLIQTQSLYIKQMVLTHGYRTLVQVIYF